MSYFKIPYNIVSMTLKYGPEGLNQNYLNQISGHIQFYQFSMVSSITNRSISLFPV